jgi:hypothetical protein
MIPTPDDIHKAADRLVECGFATRFVVSPHESRCDLTPDGKILVESIQRLFRIPDRSMYQVSPAEIMAMVGLILSLSSGGSKPASGGRN